MAKAERYLYLNQIILADRDWLANDGPQTEARLDGCPLNERGWEWHFLKRRCRAEMLRLSGCDKPIIGLSYSSDGKLLAADVGRGLDRGLKVWDTDTGKELLTFKRHKNTGFGRAVALAFAPDGRHIASADAHEIHVWDPTTGKILYSREWPVSNLTALAYGAEGKRLAATTNGPEIIIWDADGSRRMISGRQDASRITPSLAFSPDGQWLLSAGYAIGANNLFAGFLQLWDVQTGKTLRSFGSHRGQFTRVAFSPDGKYIASGDGHGALQVWEARTGDELAALHGHTGAVEALTFSLDGHRLAAAAADGVTIWERDARAGWESHDGGNTITLHGARGSLAFHPDGRHLAAGSWGSSIKVWDLDNGQDGRVFRGHQDFVDDVAFYPDSRRLATADGDGVVKVWDATTGAEFLSIRGTGGCAAVDPAGRLLATADDNVVTVRDATTGKEVFTCRGHSKPIEAIGFSPDGRSLASVGEDGVKTWDTEAGRELRTFCTRDVQYRRVAFSPDSRELAAASFSGLTVWEAGTGKQTLDSRGIRGCVAFSPDGQLIAAQDGQMNGEISIRDRRTGKEALPPVRALGRRPRSCFQSRRQPSRFRK